MTTTFDPDLNPTNLLWHYTSWAAYESIARTGKLWASKIDCLNDEMELKQANQRLVNDVVAAVEKAFGDKIDFTDHQSLTEAIDTISSTPTCVICFSASYDQLSQWRAYSGDGPAIALGFSRDALRQTVKVSGANLHECIYNDSEHIKLLSPLVKEILAGWPPKSVTATGESTSGKRSERHCRACVRLGQRLRASSLRKSASGVWWCRQRKRPIHVGAFIVQKASSFRIWSWTSLLMD
jgi:hypothetical protein